MRRSVLLVCLGNICRSPLAEAALRREVDRLQLDVGIDSAGTDDWHVGRPPDRRAIAVALKNGMDISQFRARHVRAEDFQSFDYIVALDADNLAYLTKIRPENGKAELSLLLDHVTGREGQPVADPYYGHEDEFDVTWSDVTAGAQALARKIASM